MNDKQRTYAINRIATIAALHRTRITEKFTTKPERLTWRKALAEGLPFKDSLFSSDDLGWKHASDVFDFGDRAKPAHITDEGVAALSLLTASENSTKDAIMLGDSEEALKAIAEFEAKL